MKSFVTKFFYICIIIFVINVFPSFVVSLEDNGFCKLGEISDECDTIAKESDATKYKYIFYDVNPGEGFNLRRDVYIRMAVFTHNLKKRKQYANVKLVLPPFSNLYHWQSSDIGYQGRIPWHLFFDIKSLQSFAPVVELYEVFVRERTINLDRIYILQPFEDAFENGVFEDKWKITRSTSCKPFDNFWGYNNITFTDVTCVQFQGGADKLKELIDLHPSDGMILITNAQTPLHDEYGTKKYWNARKSMKFNPELVSIAEKFIKEELNCFKVKCDNYIGVHWRRGDFARSRYKEVPSIMSTVKQISEIMNREYKSLIKTVFIATDSLLDEFEELKNIFESMKINVKRFSPTVEIKNKFKDGGVAIIDQIICSHATYFIGTHESTFTFRIQEEREIFGFDSHTTFNRLCPDVGPCERPSRWRIVH